MINIIKLFLEEKIFGFSKREMEVERELVKTSILKDLSEGLYFEPSKYQFNKKELRVLEKKYKIEKDFFRGSKIKEAARKGIIRVYDDFESLRNVALIYRTFLDGHKESEEWFFESEEVANAEKRREERGQGIKFCRLLNERIPAYESN